VVTTVRSGSGNGREDVLSDQGICLLACIAYLGTSLMTIRPKMISSIRLNFHHNHALGTFSSNHWIRKLAESFGVRSKVS
jgi:hypothetical protein